MSASREKNKRKEQAAVPETANEAKKGMSKGLKTTLIAVCTVLVVCIVVFFYMLTSGFFASHTTAATVSGHNLSPAMVNYFYKNAYSTMQEQYGDFMSYIRIPTLRLTSRPMTPTPVRPGPISSPSRV